MTQKLLHFFDGRVSEKPAPSKDATQDRLPVGTAVAIIAVLSIALWSLIAIAINSLI